MTRSFVILRNVASNWAGFAVNAAVTVLLTPFILQELGAARYGIWVLTSSIVGYYGLLDLGFRAGVTQYLTRYLAVRDDRRASECLSSAVAVLGLLGIVMLGLSVLAATFAPAAFELEPALASEAFWCILIVGCSSAVQFALSPYTSIFTATQRFDLANAIGVGTRLLTACGIVAALQAGWGLIGVSAATCAASGADYIIRWRVAHRLAPQLSVSLRSASLARVREIGAFGAWNSLISINTFVYQHVPNFLIGAVMPIAAVGYYALATGLTRQINSVLGPVGQVVYPAAAQLHAQHDQRSLERLYHDGSRFMLLVAIGMLMPAAFWAEDFYRLWVGPTYVSGESFHSVATLFRILVVAIGTSCFSLVAGPLLTGAGHVRVVATALICGSVINLSLSLLLIRPYGLAGVAAATGIASLIVDFAAMPLLVQRKLGLSAAAFFRRACLRPLCAASMLALALGTIRLSGAAGHWLQFGVQAAAAGAAALMILVGVGVTAAERQRYLLEPLRRITARARPAEVSG